jgi:hypothetical protein
MNSWPNSQVEPPSVTIIGDGRFQMIQRQLEDYCPMNRGKTLGEFIIFAKYIAGAV